MSAASAHYISRGSADTDSMEISMRSDSTIHTSLTSPSTVFQHSRVDEQVMDQFEQLKTMLSSFLRPRQETTRTAFCNYLESEVETLEDRDFQTFSNEAVKLLSGIQSRVEERISQPQQPTLCRSSSANSTYVPQTQTTQRAADFCLSCR